MQLQAVLSAIDKNFTSTLDQAIEAINDVSKANNDMASKSASTGNSVEGDSHKMVGGFMQMATAMGAVAVAAKAFDVVKNAVGDAAQRFDTLNKYPKVMNALGYSTKDVAASSKTLNKGIQGLPTSLDSITKSAQQLAPLTGGANKAAQSAVALNDAFLASSASSEDASRGLLQYTQMLSTGKVDMMSWRTLMETMPISLRKVANAFGFAGKSAEQDLYQALQSGQITMDQLNDKFIELDKGANGFAKLAKTNSAGIQNAFENAHIAIVRGITSVMQAIDSSLHDNGLPGIADMITSVGDSIEGVFNKIVAAVPPVIAALAPFIRMLRPFSKEIKILVAAIMGLGAIAMLSSKIAPMITVFGALNGTVKGATKSIGGLLSKLNPFSKVGKTAGESLDETTKGANSVGNSAPQAASGASALAKNIALIGVGVGAAAAGMALLVLSITQLAKTGNAGSVALSMVTASMTALIVVMTMAGKIIGELGPKAAMSYAGMALLVTSFALLVSSITLFASTGQKGITALTAVTAAVSVITIVVAACAKVFEASAVGLVAFGAAILMVGAGIGAATAGMAMLLNAFNNFSASSKTIVSAMTAIGQGFAMMLTAFVTTLATQIPVVSQAVMQMILGMMVAFNQALPQMMIVGTQIIVNFLNGIAQAMPQIGPAAINVLNSFANTLIANAAQIVDAGLRILEALVDGIGENIQTIIDVAIKAVMYFVYGVGYAIGKVMSQGWKLILLFVKGIMQGLSGSRNAGGSNAKSVVNGLKSISLADVGKWMIRGLINGIKGLAHEAYEAAATIARNIKNTIQRALKIHSPSRVMRDEVGIYIPAGLAVGMLKNISAVTSAAQSISDAAMISLPKVDDSKFNNSLSAINNRMGNMSMDVGGTLSSTATIDNTTSRTFEARMTQMMQETINKLDNVDQHPIMTVDTMHTVQDYQSKSDAQRYAMLKGGLS